MSFHFKHCKGLKMKPVDPGKVGNDMASPSCDMTAGKSRDQPKKKKKKTKSHKKFPEVPPPTSSVVNPHCSAHTVMEKPPIGAEEVSPKMKSPMRSGKHSLKHGKDCGERTTQEECAIEGHPTKGEDLQQGQN